jgi:hypothetical protein
MARSRKLIDNDDGTVTDPATSRMWQKEETPRMTYEEATAYCQDLNLGGKTDWRLPRKDELSVLAVVEFDVLQQYFPNLHKERYWAYTSEEELSWADSPDRIAYTLDFDPSSNNYRKPTSYFRTYKYYVRALR